jgi:phosphoribosylformylglycinamidine synthase
VAHGEGQVNFSIQGSLDQLKNQQLVAMRFVDHYGQPTLDYPRNPNGSIDGITGVTTPDGRFTALMPHPERASDKFVANEDGRSIFESLLN